MGRQETDLGALQQQAGCCQFGVGQLGVIGQDDGLTIFAGGEYNLRQLCLEKSLEAGVADRIEAGDSFFAQMVQQWQERRQDALDPDLDAEARQLAGVFGEVFRGVVGEEVDFALGEVAADEIDRSGNGPVAQVDRAVEVENETGFGVRVHAASMPLKVPRRGVHQRWRALFRSARHPIRVPWP